ncbi:DEKNAAC101490 [Brettanomyces naardenensis]|uniref:Pre-rRNA-processing protein ESF2 n=1 Tax=Brettanomyces naardenensis TaxID=13370 RepID=A0A448YHY4_BRENA|nr:DEKNAAC101490 [Brettanomyces naardenensis]
MNDEDKVENAVDVVATKSKSRGIIRNTMNIHETGSDSEEEPSDEEEEEEEDDDDSGEQMVAKKFKVSTIGEESDNNSDFGSDDEFFGYSGEEEEGEVGAGSGSASEYDEVEEIEKQLLGDSTLGTHKIKKLTPEQLLKEQKKVKRTGVVYLSSIPPYMKPTKIRQIMTRFGEIGRIFLKPEDSRIHKARMKSGGNRKRKFDEGWCEFVNKKEAKLAAQTLNGNILGGKKHSFYHDDIMNVKYLKGFKWEDLTSALNREIEIRENKMEAELSREHRMNRAYIDSVETSKKVENIKRQKRKREVKEGGNEKKREKGQDDEAVDVRRVFKQRSIATNRAGADSSQKTTTTSGKQHDKLENVLNKLF